MRIKTALIISLVLCLVLLLVYFFYEKITGIELTQKEKTQLVQSGLCLLLALWLFWLSRYMRGKRKKTK